jgi:two-component system sensor histidine kinase TctE
LKTLRAQLQRIGASLRGRLLIYLIGPLLLLLVLGIAVDHRVIITPIYSAFDRSLARAAVAITAHIHRGTNGNLDIPLPERPPPPLRSTIHEQFYYRVSKPDGRTVAGTADLPIVPTQEAQARDMAYGDIVYQGQSLRAVSYRTDEAGEPLIVTAAETPHRRDRAMQRMDIALGVNDTVQMLLTLGVALAGIAIALRPLRRLHDSIARRQSTPQALDPVVLDKVPTEVQPLVDSLNTLLVTVRESSLAQQHFLANAAHQLRTPLTGLKAQLEVLGREVAGTPLQERIALLHGGIDRLAHTANQLLALARAEPSSHNARYYSVIDLGALVGDIIDGSIDRALDRQIDLGAECRPAQIPGVYWLLHESLLNLLDNALRHTPAGGHVTIRSGVVDGVPFMEVEDDGPGIPAPERDRVRERYYRGSGSLGEGTGLGLAIVDEAAKAHSGRLLILDGHGGRGARMRIEFAREAGQG